jgi:hypothetical protein
MIKTSDIDFQRITPTQFEELSFKLIRRFGFQEIRWRQGAGDNGRDIQAINIEGNQLVGSYEEKWFFECKHYKGGVPPVEFDSKFAWATAEKAKNLAFILSSHITNNGDVWFNNRKAGVDYNVHLIEGNELKELLLEHLDLVKEFGLIESNLKLINLIYDKWIINDCIPSWHIVITTLQETNFNHLNINETLLLISLMVIHIESSNNVEGDEVFICFDRIIEFGISLYFDNVNNEVIFEKTTWNKIEWTDDVNFGQIDYFPEEEGYSYASVNKVKFDNVDGLFGILINFNDENNLIIKPFFIAQDSSLSLTKFQMLSQEKAIEFKKDYIENRPIEPKIKTMDNFTWDTWDTIEDEGFFKGSEK